MATQSAGILLYQLAEDGLRVLLVHPGGPFWARKDAGAWSIPKGEYRTGEDPAAAAQREFTEEVGPLPDGDLTPLGEIRQAGGKRVTAFALHGAFETANFVSNSCEIEWPPRSGRRMTIPEIDRAAWLTLDEARAKILASQAPLLDRLATRLHL